MRDVDRNFGHAALATLIEPVFDGVASSMIESFVRRAEQLFSQSPDPIPDP